MSAQIPSVKYDENNSPYIGVGDHKIRLENEQPTEAVLEKARNELREIPDVTGPAIDEFREMLKGELLSIVLLSLIRFEDRVSGYKSLSNYCRTHLSSMMRAAYKIQSQFHETTQSPHDKSINETR